MTSSSTSAAGALTRTFVAIELNDAMRARVAAELAHLRAALPAVHWVDPASLHLTLAFLGELEAAQLARVYDATAQAAALVRPFALRLGELGTFGPERAPRVIWLGVAGDAGDLAQLARLHEALATALEARGFARDPRPFAAHLTLARLRTPPTPAQLARLHALLLARRAAAGQPPSAPDGATLAVREISLMRSELARPQARYTCLRAVPLGGR